MYALGILLKKPSFSEFTWAALIACLWWAAGVGIYLRAVGPFDPQEAGAALIVMFWGCLCSRCGIRVEQGPRHLALNLLCAAVLLGLYHGLLAIFLG